MSGKNMRGINTAVASHYNEREQQTRTERMESPIYALRCINNWVKSVLIHDHVAPDTQFDVLDLCGGRGGDLNKWARHGARRVTLVDLAKEEVNRARERWQQQTSSRSRTNVEFVCADAFSPLPQLLDNAFDVVSCQFALHYAFEKSEAVQSLFENVSRALKPGGVFICTFPDAERVKNYCFRPPQDTTDSDSSDSQKSGNGIYRNSICKIAFADEENNIAAGRLPAFSSLYRFSLGDAINDCPEYLVSHKVLLKEADIAGLTLVRSQTFDDLCHDAVDRNQEHSDLWKAMVQRQPSMDEWDVVCLYRVCVFVREKDEEGYSGERRRQVSYKDCWHTLPGFENSRFVFSGEEQKNKNDGTEQAETEEEEEKEFDEKQKGAARGKENEEEGSKDGTVRPAPFTKTKAAREGDSTREPDIDPPKKRRKTVLSSPPKEVRTQKKKTRQSVESDEAKSSQTKSAEVDAEVIVRKPASAIVYRDGTAVKKGTRAKPGDTFEHNGHIYMKADGSGWLLNK